MQQSLKNIINKKIEKNDDMLTYGLLVADKLHLQKVRECLVQELKHHTNDVVFAQKYFDIDASQTIKQNQRQIGVTKNTSKFDAHKKIKEFSEKQQIVIRLQIMSETAQLVFIDEIFSENLSTQQKQEIMHILRKLQKQKRMRFIAIFLNEREGVFFDKLWGYQNKLQSFLPLK